MGVSNSVYFANLTRWNGERIGDILPPLNIGAMWSDLELEAIGLYRPKPPLDVPEGMQQSAAVEVVDGVIRFGIEEAPPPERRRVDKWVIAERIEAAGKSDAAYELLTMPGNRVAFIKWNMPIVSVFYDDPETLLFINALGLDPAVIMAP